MAKRSYGQGREKRVVVITGASSGIGALLAKRFAEAGDQVVLLARTVDKLERVAGEIGEQALALPADVAQEDSVQQAVRTILDRFGRIDVWINNAGYGVFETFAQAETATIADMMDVNYMGTVRCLKAVLPSMLEAGRGHLVNVASMAGKIGSPKASGYSATKHAVLGLTNCLRQELAGTGVAVTAINPGPVDTPFFERADPGGGYAERVRWFMLKPERVAEAVFRAVERRQPEVNLPWTAAAGIKLYQLFPRLFDRIAGRMLNQK